MKKTIRQGMACLFVIGLLVTFTADAMAADKPSTAKNEIDYSVLVNKTQNSKKHRIRLFSRGQDQILCTVNGVQGASYQVFVFNVESKLVTHTKMLSGETAALNIPSKGCYLFEVLSNDERVESGQLTIK